MLQISVWRASKYFDSYFVSHVNRDVGVIQIVVSLLTNFMFSRDTTSNNQIQLLTVYSRDIKSLTLSVNCIIILRSAAVTYIWYICLNCRYLKLENVLVGRDGHCKVSDFGLSKIGLSHQDRTSSCCGTPQYMAPEVIMMLNLNVIT
jgi:serine/threonine protein kinase